MCVAFKMPIQLYPCPFIELCIIDWDSLHNVELCILMYTTVMWFETFISRIFGTLHLTETENNRNWKILDGKINRQYAINYLHARISTR